LSEKVVLDREDIRRTLVRIAHEIVEKTGGDRIAIVGIHRRGAVIAARVQERVEELVGAPVPLGDLDISFYRDDVAMRGPDRQPVVHASSASSSPCWPTAATASSPSAPTTWARTFQPPATSA